MNESGGTIETVCDACGVVVGGEAAGRGEWPWLGARGMCPKESDAAAEERSIGSAGGVDW